MDIITIVSPDKISISMFTDFLMKFLGGGWRPGYLHYLMTPEAVDTYVGGFMNQNPKSIMRYYSDKKITDPLKACPKKLFDQSSSVVWFALYSTEAQILKDEAGVIGNLIERWQLNIKRMGGGAGT